MKAKPSKSVMFGKKASPANAQGSAPPEKASAGKDAEETEQPKAQKQPSSLFRSAMSFSSAAVKVAGAAAAAAAAAATTKASKGSGSAAAGSGAAEAGARAPDNDDTTIAQWLASLGLEPSGALDSHAVTTLREGLDALTPPPTTLLAAPVLPAIDVQEDSDSESPAAAEGSAYAELPDEDSEYGDLTGLSTPVSRQPTVATVSRQPSVGTTFELLFVGSGVEEDSSTFTAQVFANIATKFGPARTWNRVADLPERRTLFGCVSTAAGDAVIVNGAFGKKSQSNLLRWNANTDRWTWTDVAGGTHRKGVCSALVGSRVMTCGGLGTRPDGSRMQSTFCDVINVNGGPSLPVCRMTFSRSYAACATCARGFVVGGRLPCLRLCRPPLATRVTLSHLLTLLLPLLRSMSSVGGGKRRHRATTAFPAPRA